MTMLADQINGYIDRASWIRKMFETGAAMKAEFGADAVFDFSLGNPDLPPPAEVRKALADLAEEADRPFVFGYMPNPGYPWAREALAGRISEEQGVRVEAGDVIITCGAAGAINVFFRTVLNPGDEIVCPAPFFVEYGFYAENHQGVFRPVPSDPDTFALDLAAMEEAVTEKTRVVLVNSPNNPTGQIYTREELEGLAAILTRKSEEFGRPIYLISDEPYRFLAYDDVAIPSLLDIYPYSAVMSSFSKNLSLAGERVGYAVLAPDMPGKETLMNGLTLANRILGFVNAPAVGQVLMAKAINAGVDISVYVERRNAMARVLDDAGIEYAMPKGAFYFFPKVPAKFAGDDVAFVNRLQEEKVLAVPGRGFGMPGYVRLSFCVPLETITGSAEGFKRATA